MDELFVGRPGHLVPAFDQIMLEVAHWEPNSVGASRHTVVFTNYKAWLIVKPMTMELDVKFYHPEPLYIELFKKVASFYGNYVHHIQNSGRA